jgi:membrane-associated protease RseP (regulator of RpoE activity)
VVAVVLTLWAGHSCKITEDHMAFWFVLLLGLFTYFMVQRIAANNTRTPVWLLSLVLMTPAIVWAVWITVYGDKQPPSRPLILLMLWLLVICPPLFWLLFRLGRNSPKELQTERPNPESQSAIHPTAEPVPVRPIQPTEETQLRNCFPWSIYYIQNIEYRPQAVICRGQLRTTASNAYQQIKANIEAQFGDRFLLIFQEGNNSKPFFVLVPNTQTAQTTQQNRSEPLTRPGLALFLLVATLITTTLVGAQTADPTLPSIWRIVPLVQAIVANPSLLLLGLPYALGLMTILGIHELGHYLAARFYKIRATLPYFIPMPFFLGTFGAFIQMRSPVPNRKALFDVSIMGPLAGFIVTLPILIWGLAHSDVVPLDEKNTFLNPDALNPHYSILLALLAKLALGSALTAKSAIDLHPVAIAGFLGLIVTALNLMPVGQLDGGHIVHAMFGQRTAISIGQIARLLLLLLSLIQPEFLWWAIILLFIPLVDEPALNDVTELDNQRDMLGLLAMALLLVIVLPLPGAIANWLQI